MFNKNRSRYNKRIVIVTVVLIAVSVFSLLASQGLPLSEFLSDPVANIEYYVIKAPIRFVSNVYTEYSELKTVYRENKRLKRTLDNYAREVAYNEVLSNELNELKKITGNDSLTTDYKVKYTTVIQRDVENWNNQITIDVGKASNVTKGMAVITAKGMIGTVTDVSAISSTVTLLTSEKLTYQIPVMITSGKKTYYGLLDDYDVDAGAYTVKLLSTVTKIQKGSNVTTSGLGGKNTAPRGILVGTVTGFSAGDSAEGKSVTVKPSADFDSLNYVAVVQREK